VRVLAFDASMSPYALTMATDDIVHRARHPYTQALIASVDARSGGIAGVEVVGEIPSPMNPPGGCPFNPRCPFAEDRCRAEKPALREIAPAQFVACHFAERIPFLPLRAHPSTTAAVAAPIPVPAAVTERI